VVEELAYLVGDFEELHTESLKGRRSGLRCHTETKMKSKELLRCFSVFGATGSPGLWIETNLQINNLWTEI